MSEQALHHPENYVIHEDDVVKRLSFIVHGDPIPQGSKKAFRNPRTGGTILAEDSKRSRPWRQEIVESIRAYDLAVGLDGPVNVLLDFYFRRPKHHYGTGRNANLLKASAPQFVAVKPDADKVARTALDALVLAGVIRDDSQVAVLTVTKMYGERPGMRATVSRL